MFFGCLPCCGGEGGEGGCPNHENTGIVAPLSVNASVGLSSHGWFPSLQPGALLYIPPNQTLVSSTGNGTATFLYGYVSGLGDVPSVLSTGTATITSNAQLVLSGRGRPYPYLVVTNRLSSQILPTYTSRFWEIPCRQNQPPQEDDAKTTVTFQADVTPGGASTVASQMRIIGATVHVNDVSTDISSTPTIPSNVPRPPNASATLSFSISGLRSSDPTGFGQLDGAPGSLSWTLSFQTFLSINAIGTHLASTFTTVINSITDANGASASVSAFSPEYSQISAGPPLIP